MAMNKTQAGKLLNGREMDLFESTLSGQLRGVTSKDLQKRIARVRIQREKQADLLRRQRVATRQRTGTKDGPKGSANERTALKEQLFTEALDRLETQHAKTAAAEQREAQRNARAQAKAKAQGAKDKAATAAGKGKAAAKTTKTSSTPAKGGATKSAKAPASAKPAKKAKKGPGMVKTLKTALKKKAAAKPAGPRGAGRSDKAPASGPSGDGGATPAGQAPLAQAKDKRLQAAGLQRTQAHVSSAGRRSQGARDQRG